MKMRDIFIETTKKAKCGSKPMRIWIDFSNNDAGKVRELWGKIYKDLGLPETIPHCRYIFEMLEMLARMGYVEYFDY